MGGGYPSAASNRVEEYDPAAGTWITKSPALLSGGYGACVEVGGKIYLFGVATLAGMPDMLRGEVQEYNPAVDN